MLEKLYKRTKDGKIQQWYIIVEQVNKDIIITKVQGKFDGKVQQYQEVISVGKQNRSVYEQAEFEAESQWKKKKDEGYKSLIDLGWDERTDLTLRQWLEETLPQDRTDANGILKPMKCTPIEKGLKKIKFPAYAQPKLDGVRGFLRWDGEQWRATSSSGKSYDVMARHILETLNKNEDFPADYILDGEFYIHGTPLEYLSGWARKQTPISEHLNMDFCIFDVGIKLPMVNRRTIIEDSLTVITEYTQKINIVQTEVVHNMEEFKQLHDKWVAEGYEGAILRNADGVYEFGIRSTSIFKLKDFKDEEFKIVDMILGARGTEDLVFVCLAKNNQTFKANPVGNRQIKEEYWNNKEEIIGKLAMVRYLTMSQKGLPQGNPIMKTIRDYE